MFLHYVLEPNHELTFHGLTFTINVSKDRIGLATRSLMQVFGLSVMSLVAHVKNTPVNLTELTAPVQKVSLVSRLI